MKILKDIIHMADLAAQVIGFCGNDNQGLDGIEAKYDDELKGTNGKIKRQTNAAGEKFRR